jgi:hypothetical protein
MNQTPERNKNRLIIGIILAVMVLCLIFVVYNFNVAG